MGDPDAALLAKFGTLEPDVLAELKSMMRLHDLSAEEVFWKWEAFSIKMDIDVGEVSLSAVRNLKANLQGELEKKNSKAREIKVERKVVGTPKGGVGDVYGVLDGLVPGTPVGSAGRKSGGLGKKTPASKLKAEVMSSSPAGAADGKLPSKGEDNLKCVVSFFGVSLSCVGPPLLCQ